MITKIDQEKLYNLIKPFYNLTGIKVAVFDCDCKEILAYPAHSTAFCSMMDPQLCSQSTQKLCEKCVREKRVLIEKCHAGLTEVVAPLFDGVSVMGYIMFGQITNRQDRADFSKEIISRLTSHGLDACKLQGALEEILYYSDTQLDDASKILGALARCIVYDKLVYPAEASAAQKIMKYIRQNLAGDLSVKALCTEFYLSKSEIYRITKPYMPDGIAAFVKEERMKKAAELLKTTNKASWEIAEETGFADVNYFLRSFKSVYGISAMKYRGKL